MSKPLKVHYNIAHDQPVELIVSLVRDFAREHRGDTVVAAVCGQGGTGKSTLCRALGERLPGCRVLRLDDYNRPRTEREARGLLGSHPEAVKLELLVRHLTELRQGRPIEKPVYDPVNGHDHATETVEPAPILLLDGEAAAFEGMRLHIDFLIYVDADPETSLSVRLSRDVQERGYDLEKVMRVFRQSNLTDFPRFGSPTRAYADIVLHFHPGFHHTVKQVAEEHRNHPALG